MRILVTGAAGFVGQHLLRWLCAETEDEIVAGSLDGRPAVDAMVGTPAARVRWVALDVTSSEGVRRVIEAVEPDRVYHLAGQSSVGASFEAPLQTWDINATGTLRLVTAAGGASRRPCRILVISSAEVYGVVPEAEQPIREEQPIRPVSPYGASKAAAELAALQQCATGEVEVVVARSFNHAGPGQDGRFFFPTMARQLAAERGRGGNPVLRVGNLEPCRDFLDVRDVVRAYAWLMERGENGGVYNVCSGRAHALRELLDELIEVSGTGARVEVDPERFRPVDVPVLIGDPARIRALGWEPRIPLRQTMRDLLESYSSG